MAKIALPTTNANLIATAGALLGYAPTNSVIAIMLQDDDTAETWVRCAIRLDVRVTVEQAARFPTICNLRARDYDAAILLVVCDPDYDVRARIIIDTMRDALQAAGIPITRRLLTRDVTNTNEWIDPDTGRRGPTYPFTDSLIAAERVAAGQRISRSRSDVEREFDTIDPAPPVKIGHPAELADGTLEEINAVLAGRQSASPTLATRAGIVITAYPMMREAVLAVALKNAQLAADLWTHLARQLRGLPRAEALTVAAVCNCLVGDHVRAGIAISTALTEAQQTATPAPRLTHLMDVALQTGATPDKIRKIVVDMSHAGHLK
jgi:Domain of unknown function (DUF4192)